MREERKDLSTCRLPAGRQGRQAGRDWDNVDRFYFKVIEINEKTFQS